MVKDSSIRIVEGDWVTGRSENDELFTGYVEGFDRIVGNLKVKVVKSDHEQAIGKTIQSQIRNVQLLPASERTEQGYILNWIDIALMTQDKPWFIALTAELQQLQALKTKTRSNERDFSLHKRV